MSPERVLASCALATLALAGCAATAPRRTLCGGRTIAVLPMDNRSNDVRAAGRVRAALVAQMGKDGWIVADTERVDAALKGLGVTDGGQLPVVPFDQIKSSVAADVWCYGAVVEYGFKSVLLLSQRKVEVALKCRDAGGVIVFSDDKTGITTKAGLDAGADLVLDVTGKVVKSVKDGAKALLPGETAKKAADLTDQVADVELTQETQQAIGALLGDFPR